jgi:hypothetical protein
MNIALESRLLLKDDLKIKDVDAKLAGSSLWRPVSCTYYCLQPENRPYVQTWSSVVVWKNGKLGSIKYGMTGKRFNIR